MVQFLFPPPERTKFETSTGLPRPKLLDFLDFNIRTKMAVVRLRQRKRPERDRKRPEMGPQGGIRGSDNLPGMAVFCGVPTADQERKKIVPNGWTGGGKGFGASVRTRFGTPVNFNPHAAFFGRALSGRYSTSQVHDPCRTDGLQVRAINCNERALNFSEPIGRETTGILDPVAQRGEIWDTSLSAGASRWDPDSDAPVASVNQVRSSFGRQAHSRHPSFGWAPSENARGCRQRG
jgi:hypothetical protein